MPKTRIEGLFRPEWEKMLGTPVKVTDAERDELHKLIVKDRKEEDEYENG